jgi:pyridoxine 4-dehydrogenase
MDTLEATALKWLLVQPDLAHDPDALLCEAQTRYGLGPVTLSTLYLRAIEQSTPEATGPVYRRLRDARPPTPPPADRRPAPRLGDTGRLKLGRYRFERLGLGAMRLISASYFTNGHLHDNLALPPDPDACRRTMQSAIRECGIGYVDFARGYGPWAGAGEAFFREWWYPYPADLLFATKVGYERPDAGGWGINLAPEVIARDLAASVRQLGSPIPLVYLVVGSTPDVVVRNRPARLRDALAPMLEARQRGEIQHIGLANVSRQELEELEPLGVDAVQNKFTLECLEDPGRRAVLELCERHAIPFVAWGIFQNDGPEPWEPTRELAGAAAEIGVTPQELAIGLLLHASKQLVALTGSGGTRSLYSSVRGANLKLSESFLRRFGIGGA